MKDNYGDPSYQYAEFKSICPEIFADEDDAQKALIKAFLNYYGIMEIAYDLNDSDFQLVDRIKDLVWKKSSWEEIYSNICKMEDGYRWCVEKIRVTPKSEKPL